MKKFNQLLTWVDIARRFAEIEPGLTESPPWLVRARVDWDGVIIEVTEPVPEDNEIRDWLASLFPSGIPNDKLEIQLEGPDHARMLPVEVVPEQAGGSRRPSFGTVDGVISFKTPTLVRKPLPIPVIAVQSVKGGTGRTTTAITLSLRWAEMIKKPVLLVDADLEAPGISYLFRESQREIRISLEDIVALAHSEPTEGAPATVSFASAKLKDHRLGKQVVVLPLRRNLDELASSALRPEHLVTPQHPFALADLLANIGQASGCDGVVVDVRAGLVPLGANLGLDPEVAPVLVTTLSGQAIDGTAALVKFLCREIRRSGSTPRPPLLVVNRVPTIFQSTGVDQTLIEPLISKVVESLLAGQHGDVDADESSLDDSLSTDPISIVRIGEIADLQVSARGWHEFIHQLQSAGFSHRLGEIADTWLRTEAGATISEPADTTTAIASIAQRRAMLHEFSTKLIAAESFAGQVPKPLVTQPLAALVQRFRSEVPIAVSEGAKGTGKTLNARFLVSQMSWDKAVQELSGGNDAVAAPIIPVCGSIQSSASLQKEFDEQRQRIAHELNLDAPQMIAETTKWLKTQRVEKAGRDWLDRWLDVIAWSTGFEVEKMGAGSRFIEHLRSRQKNVVAVIEGLEELYESASAEGVSEMMRALLVDLPQRLRGERGRPVGCIVYVRRDTVEAALHQNVAQYRMEYAPFALTWNEDDVLELAAWLTTRSGALPDLWTPEFREKPHNAKGAALEPVWGRKLGPDDVPGKPRVREAYTATWIIAVLSDMQGRLVPRDLVRLLANAAKKAASGDVDSAYSNRLLPPKSLRDAIEPTSTAKVSETEEEITELKSIFAKFRQKPEAVAAPLNAEAVATLGLAPEDMEILKRHGIVFGESPPYEVPELFRRGLGLRHSGARYSVVNLWRRARQRFRGLA